jgi:hypothetical protein
MDFGLFKRITREMREAGVEEIGVFYLGESFMNPRLLVDCIAYLKREIGMPTSSLPSNASMSFPEAVEECMKAGLDSLKWSVNAADESQYRTHHGRVGPALRQRAGQHTLGLGSARARADTAPGCTPPPFSTTVSSANEWRACWPYRCSPTWTSITGFPSTLWAHSQQSGRSGWATARQPETRGE